jgi:hypothetical protein
VGVAPADLRYSIMGIVDSDRRTSKGPFVRAEKTKRGVAPTYHGWNWERDLDQGR